MAECSTPPASPVSAAQEPNFTFLYSPTVGSVVELPEDQEEATTGRKRKKNPDNWTKKHVKKPGLRKNSPRIRIESLTDCCKKLCVQKFSCSHLEKMRSEFEGLYYEQQNIYLNGLLHRHETKRTTGHSRKSNPTLSSNGKRVGRPPAEKSGFSFTYSLRNEKGINVTVCQRAFCAVHGFGPKRLLVLRRKITSDESTTGIEPDRRGKHSNRHVVSDEVRELVRDHIRSFPARQSHYSRKDNSGRVYLSAELSIVRLYRDFLQKHDPEYIELEEENRRREIMHQPPQTLRKPLVSEHFYHDIFVTEFNIHFGYPRSDTCSRCDDLTLQIEEASSESEKVQLQEKLDAHQTRAEAGYNSFRYDRELCHKSWEAITNNSSST